jgi:hypothetical protein
MNIVLQNVERERQKEEDDEKGGQTHQALQPYARYGSLRKITNLAKYVDLEQYQQGSERPYTGAQIVQDPKLGQCLRLR